MINNVIKSGIVLLLAMLACGLLSLYFGKELSWDLANYHYYNPYAFLHSRSNMDFWPSSFMHQYLNPSMDFLSYYLITHFSPLTTEFVLGAIHGINFWLLYLIAHSFIKEHCNKGLAALLALLGMYGPTALPGIGSMQQDNSVSIFVLGFVLLHIKALQNYVIPSKNSFVLKRHVSAVSKYERVTRTDASATFPLKMIFSSGLLLGIGIGLKLTAGLFAVGAFLAAIMLPVPIIDRVKLIFIWGVATVIGIVLSAGYWMHIMWLQHHNPFFPFLNHLFHSLDFLPINWRDVRFMPRGIGQTLFFPYFFCWNGSIADAPFRDFRFAIVYTLFIIASINWLWKKKRSLEATSPAGGIPTAGVATAKTTVWLFAFFIGSYIVWQSYFSIARYLVALEMLAPLVIYLLIKNLVKNTYVYSILLTITFYALAFFMIYTPMVRAPWYNTSYFNIKLPDFVSYSSHAMVLLAYPAYANNLNPRPQTYLIPFFPANWHFIGIPFWHEKYLPDKTTTKKTLTLIHDYQHKIYLLTSDQTMPALYQAANYFGLTPNGECEKIFSDRQKITHQNVLLCPVKRNFTLTS